MVWVYAGSIGSAIGGIFFSAYYHDPDYLKTSVVVVGLLLLLRAMYLLEQIYKKTRS